MPTDEQVLFQLANGLEYNRAKLKWCMANRHSKEPVLQLLHFSQWRNTSKDLFASLWTWSPPFMDCDWIITSNLELQQFSTCDVEEHIRWAYDGRKHGDYDPEQQERQDQRMDDPSANLDSATWSDRPWEEATATADGGFTLRRLRRLRWLFQKRIWRYNSKIVIRNDDFLNFNSLF